jgi:lysophospholipase L1-like esterase
VADFVNRRPGAYRKEDSMRICLLLLALHQFACVTVAQDNETPDAAIIVVDAAPPPDVSNPDVSLPDATATLCHHRTTGLLIGDSIVFRMWAAGLAILAADDDAVYSVAQSGATVAAEQIAYANGPYPGIRLDWVWIQVGINDILAGTSAAEIEEGLALLISTAHEQNPEAAILVGKMLPARFVLDARNLAFYPVWVEVNAWLETQGAYGVVSDSMNNGQGYLITELSQDGLHPSYNGSLFEATKLDGLIRSVFPDEPCR